MTGLAHQVTCGAGSLSPASNWPDTSQTNSAPPTANIHYVQTEKPSFPPLRTNVPAIAFPLGVHDLTDDKQQTCVNVVNRSGILKNNTEEKVILEEQECEDEKNTDLTQCLNSEFSVEVNVRASGDTELNEQCQSCNQNNMQQKGTAPLQSKVVIKETDEQSIRIPQKTEIQQQSQSDVSQCTEPCSVLSADGNMEIQPNIVTAKVPCSFQVGGDVQSEYGENMQTEYFTNNAPICSPPVSPHCAGTEGKFIISKFIPFGIQNFHQYYSQKMQLIR